jgi:hypothetical protein
MSAPPLLLPAAAAPHATIRASYWHGGAPGLNPGEYLLPPTVTGTRTTLAAYMDAADKLRSGYEANRVYVVTEYEAAELYAALYPDGGWIYRVLPEGELRPDPDCTQPGLSWSCERARIVACVQLDTPTLISVLKAVAAGGEP